MRKADVSVLDRELSPPTPVLGSGENERKQRTVGNGPSGRQGFPGHRQDRGFAALCLRQASTPFSVLASELGCHTLKGPMQETERLNSKCTPQNKMQRRTQHVQVH
uniref:Uncharacterized protein n=1 Tax=Bionectria ochroleuca TaxID=29856 RepID=A0A8H7NE60_BIOOC